MDFVTTADQIKDLQERISRAHHKQSTESIPALVAELNALQMVSAPAWVQEAVR
jgi:hypothetical protein